MSDPNPESDVRRTRWGVALTLIAIMALGLAVRLYRLDRQSIWLDEFPSVAHLGAPDVWTDLLLIRMIVPEQAQGPLYFILQYFWAHWVGASVLTLRLLPVLIGMTAIPLIFLFGRYLYGPAVGLIAALCLALSPQHIWHAQEIRPYALLTPLAILSLYGLLRALREGGVRWWVLCFAANVLLVWTHVFAILFLLVEGCFLLVFARRHFRQTMIWGVVQALLLIPWVIWMVRMPYGYSEDFVSTTFAMGRVVNDIFADDVINLHSDLLPVWKTHPVEGLPHALAALTSPRRSFDLALALVLYAAPLWLLYRIAYAWRRRTCEERSTELEHAVLLLLLLVVPGLVLGVMMFVTGRPFVSPMYTLYNTAATYIAVGGLIAALPRRRVFATAGVAVLYGYQLAIFLPWTTRADWLSASEYLRAEASPDDLILDLEYMYPGDYLGYYMGDRGIPIRRITTLQAACDDSAAFLEQPASGRERRVWLITERAFLQWMFPGFDLTAALERGLNARGLRFTYREFLGHYDILLARIERAAPFVPPDHVGLPVVSWQTIDYERLLADMGMTNLDPARHDAAAAVLRNEITFWPPLCKFYLLVHVFDLLEQGHVDLAEGLARVLLQRAPHYSLGYFAHGVVLAGKRDCDQARASFQEAFRLQPELEGFLGPFAAALCESGDASAAESAIQRIEPTGFLFTGALREAATLRF